MNGQLNVPYFQNGIPPDLSILVLTEEDKGNALKHLLDIVATDGKNGKQTDDYWLVSTSTHFVEDGTIPVVVYNNLMLNAKSRGYGYIQFTKN